MHRKTPGRIPGTYKIEPFVYFGKRKTATSFEKWIETNVMLPGNLNLPVEQKVVRRVKGQPAVFIRTNGERRIVAQEFVRRIKVAPALRKNVESSPLHSFLAVENQQGLEFEVVRSPSTT